MELVCVKDESRRICACGLMGFVEVAITILKMLHFKTKSDDWKSRLFAIQFWRLRNAAGRPPAHTFSANFRSGKLAGKRSGESAVVVS
jgi:hypothetical protein